MTASPTIAELLARGVGLDTTVLGDRQLDRAVRRRMERLALDDPSRYHRQLCERPEELIRLAEELTVPETRFLRDAAAFESLEHFAADWFQPLPLRPPLRILNLACATGEEAYSAAITLLDSGISGERFSILGVDLSERSLTVARAGLYPERSLRGLPSKLRQTYFQRDQEHYRLSAAARRPVRFISGNLNATDLLAGEPAFGVVFCRNVLIYLTEEARERVAEHLRRLVAPGGILLLGHADPVAGLRPWFEPAGGFALTRRPAVPDGSPAAETPGAPPPLPESAAKAARAAPRPRRARSEMSASPLSLAADRAGRGDYREAVRLCQQALRHEGPSARAYHLLGVIARAQGDDQRAERWLSRAVYLDALDDESLLALSLLARKRGDLPASERYRRRAERARKARDAR